MHAPSPRDVRLRLQERGYSPISGEGKEPSLPAWQKKLTVTANEIASWDAKYPAARNTGIITRNTAGIDIDILNHHAAADAVEELVRQRFGSRGKVLVRFGQRPKRLIPMRTDAPFKKKKVAFLDPTAAEGAKPPAVEYPLRRSAVRGGRHSSRHQPALRLGQRLAGRCSAC